MTGRIDFSANASVYDNRHGAFLSNEIAQQLATIAALRSNDVVLDVGAGTGRVSVPLAAFGCLVVALDLAQPMLERLRNKAPDARVALVVGLGGALPFRDASFDATVIARLMYLLPDWRDVMNEMIRALRPGGRLLHEWGNGSPDEEWVQIRERARALFEQAGVKDPFHPGAREESEVDRFLIARGLEAHGEVRAEPDTRTTLAQFLERIVAGECSYIWNVPGDVQQKCLPALKAWAAERFDLECSRPAPREIRWTVYRKGCRDA